MSDNRCEFAIHSNLGKVCPVLTFVPEGDILNAVVLCPLEGRLPCRIHDVVEGDGSLQSLDALQQAFETMLREGTIFKGQRIEPISVVDAIVQAQSPQ